MVVSTPKVEAYRDSDVLPWVFNSTQKAQDRHRNKLALLLSVYSTLVLIWLPMPRTSRAWVEEAPPLTGPPLVTFRPKPLKPTQTSLKKTNALKVPMPEAQPTAPDIQWESKVSEAIDPVEWNEEFELGLPNVAPASAAIKPMELGVEGLNRPILIKKVKAVYPKIAMRLKRTGKVKVEAILRKDGGVGDVRILDLLGGEHFGFDKAALEAVRQWKFLPATYRGEKVEVRLEVTVNFILPD